MNSKFPLPKGFTITAHTGCEGTEYNSAESIRVGAKYGKIVEVDLNFTKKGEPVLAHTFAKKDSLSLDEAFSVLAELPDTKMNIDVKIGPNLKAVYDCAVKHGVQDRILYTGIEKEKLISAKRDTPEIPFYLNETVTRFKMLRKGYVNHLVEETKRHGAIGINISYKPCTKELVDAFHKEGLIVSLYTCNDIKAMLKAIKLGADNITTKNPKALKKLIETPFCYTAHTGCSGTKPNSLEAMKTGIKNGADIVEFDLRFHKNGTAVLSHDEPEGGEVTLKEAFDLLSKHPTIKANVDVKIPTDLNQVQTLAEECGVLQQIFYTGIEEDFVAAARMDSPKIPYYLNVRNILPPKKHTREYILSLAERVKASGAVGINFKYVYASKLLVDIFQEKGLLVSIWTVNSEKDLYRILSYTPDNITTKKPELLKKILGR